MDQWSSNISGNSSEVVSEGGFSKILLIVHHPILFTTTYIRYAGMHGYVGNSEVIRSSGYIFTGFDSEHAGYGRLDRSYIYRSFIQSYNGTSIERIVNEDSPNFYLMLIGI